MTRPMMGEWFTISSHRRLLYCNHGTLIVQCSWPFDCVPLLVCLSTCGGQTRDSFMANAPVHLN